MIKVIQLISSDTIIGDIRSRGDEYVIKYPFLMEIVDDTEQGSGIRMDYLLAFSKDNCVHIKKNDVMYNYTPSDMMEEYYKRLVEYTVTHETDKILKQTIENMNEMDSRLKKLISQRFVGKDTVN
jgi:hypothetical protein